MSKSQNRALENIVVERKVVAAYFLSVDGVAEQADQLLRGWDDVVDGAGADLISTQDTVIMGRRTYDEWAGFWPTSDVEPFASFVNAVPKYIATSSPLTGDWKNSHVIEGDLTDFVRDLKQQPGGDIGIHGSISISQTLLAAGLLDELRLVISPTVAPGGKRLLDHLPAIELQTLRSTISPTGYVLTDYKVVH